MADRKTDITISQAPITAVASFCTFNANIALCCDSAGGLHAGLEADDGSMVIELAPCSGRNLPKRIALWAAGKTKSGSIRFETGRLQLTLQRVAAGERVNVSVMVDGTTIGTEGHDIDIVRAVGALTEGIGLEEGQAVVADALCTMVISREREGCFRLLYRHSNNDGTIERKRASGLTMDIGSHGMALRNPDGTCYTTANISPLAVGHIAGILGATQPPKRSVSKAKPAPPRHPSRSAVAVTTTRGATRCRY